MMASAWPPPPDRASIDELVALADVEGLIAGGAPADEYESEAERIFAAIAHFPTADLVSQRLMPILERVWQESFSLDDRRLSDRRPALAALAGEIARFFGPEARPAVRGSAN